MILGFLFLEVGYGGIVALPIYWELIEKLFGMSLEFPGAIA